MWRVCKQAWGRLQEVWWSLEHLPTQTLSSEACNSLQGLMVNLPQYRESLRPVLVAKLEALMMQKVKEWSQQAAKEEKEDTKLHKDIMQLLAELCIAWPLEGDFVDLKEEVCMALSKSHLKTAQTTLLEACDKLGEEFKAEASPESVLDSVSTLAATTIQAALPPELLGADVAQKFGKAESHVMRHFYQYIHTHHKMEPETLATFVQALQHLVVA
eukprot:769753-Amphidinium_carterae.1